LQLVAHSYTIICVLGFIGFIAFFTSELLPVYADDGSQLCEGEGVMEDSEISDIGLEPKTGAPV
jgi:hypothetical protein